MVPAAILIFIIAVGAVIGGGMFVTDIRRRVRKMETLWRKRFPTDL